MTALIGQCESLDPNVSGTCIRVWRIVVRDEMAHGKKKIAVEEVFVSSVLVSSIDLHLLHWIPLFTECVPDLSLCLHRLFSLGMQRVSFVKEH